MEKIENKLIEIMQDADEFLNRVFFCLLPEGYRHDRGDVFYRPIGNGLEIQYKVDVTDVMENGNAIVFENYFNKMGISKENLIDRAYSNTIKNFPPKFDSVCDILGISDLDGVQLYCLTNVKAAFGAGTILYPDMEKKIRNIVGDFIIIPSSVHEVLLIPDPGDTSIIKKIINEVNSTVLDPLDILSDKVFKLLDGELIEA